MIKSIHVIVISLIFLTVASAENQKFGYQCAANGKKIIAYYSYEDKSGYLLDALTIDGQDYKSDTTLLVSRGSAEFVIENYRDDKRLLLKMGAANFYQLGTNGKVYQMLCYPVRPLLNQHSNDQL